MLKEPLKESHEVENPNDTPSDFLRVEFKTAEDAATSLRGKFHREAYPPGENFEKVQFENAQIRVARLACAKTCELPAAAEPALLVALSPLRIRSSGDGSGLGPGKTKWIAAGNITDCPSRRACLTTGPLAARAHTHQRARHGRRSWPIGGDPGLRGLHSSARSHSARTSQGVGPLCRYYFSTTDAVLRGELRPWRDP